MLLQTVTPPNSRVTHFDAQRRDGQRRAARPEPPEVEVLLALAARDVAAGAVGRDPLERRDDCTSNDGPGPPVRPVELQAKGAEKQTQGRAMTMKGEDDRCRTVVVKVAAVVVHDHEQRLVPGRPGPQRLVDVLVQPLAERHV